MKNRQIKYLLAFLGLVVALLVFTVGRAATIQPMPVSADAISAFLSVIVISLVITARSDAPLRQDIRTILFVLAGLVAYTAVKSALANTIGLSGYFSLTLGAIASAVLHCSIHALTQNQ
ncbi:MAG: hypothetical protein CMQ34_06590 [Gammaproteobacteria bacterium]|nr:hypothetical protein [Gammaproteobacteria bacterium]|tara:strand:- start:175 stop:531 length:357 start_codon:yes stop_codon:yes gene_type:complete